MSHHVTVKFDAQTTFEFSFETQGTAAAIETGRQWLDKQYLELECEPLRASGKLLTSDKVISIAQAAGRKHFGQKEWALAYCKAVSLCLNKNNIMIDVREMSIRF